MYNNIYKTNYFVIPTSNENNLILLFITQMSERETKTLFYSNWLVYSSDIPLVLWTWWCVPVLLAVNPKPVIQWLRIDEGRVVYLFCF